MASSSKLHAAIFQCDQQLANDIIDKLSYEDILGYNNYYGTSLHLAISNGQTDVAINIIKRLTDDDLVTRAPHSANTPLYCAAARGNNDIVITLLERLSDKQLVIKNNYGDTPLHEAAYCGHNNVVITLLERLPKDDRFITNNKGETPLDLAEDDEIKSLLQPMVKSARI